MYLVVQLVAKPQSARLSTRVYTAHYTLQWPDMPV